MKDRKDQLTSAGFLLRLVFALVLILITYNPGKYSYYQWLVASFSNFQVAVIPVGVLLVIGWTIYIRATLHSLGMWGLLLAFALFGSLLWMIIDWGIIAPDNIVAVTWIVEIIMALVLGVGMSWSHIRRKLSGQQDVDETDG